MTANTINDLEYEYYRHPANNTAFMLLHGVRGGIDEAYILTTYAGLKERNDTVLALNFPYMTRKEERTAITFDEELLTIQIGYDFLKSNGIEKVHMIGKSMGGIVMSHWLNSHPSVTDVSASIMGYIPGPGNMITPALKGRLQVVVQGEYDRYASPEEIRSELLAHEVNGEVITIPNADHSYRDTVATNPPPYAHQGAAIAKLLQHV